MSFQSVFAKYDADKSGSFDCYELRQALHSGGKSCMCVVDIFAEEMHCNSLTVYPKL